MRPVAWDPSAETSLYAYFGFPAGARTIMKEEEREKAIRERRFKRLVVSGPLLLTLCRGRFEVTANALPEDVEVYSGTWLSGWNSAFELVLVSTSFPELGSAESSDAIPFVYAPVITRIEPPKAWTPGNEFL